MSSAENQVKRSSGASTSRSLWLIVIGFFACGALASVVLSRFVSSERLAGEISFFAALLVLYVVVKPFPEVNATHVTDLIAGSGIYLTQLLLSPVMRKSLAIGLSVVLVRIGREAFLTRFRNEGKDERNGSRLEAFVSSSSESLLLGALAFVISELVIRLWSTWQMG